MQIKSPIRCRHTSTRMAKIKNIDNENIDNTKCWQNNYNSHTFLVKPLENLTIYYQVKYALII